MKLNKLILQSLLIAIIPTLGVAGAPPTPNDSATTQQKSVRLPTIDELINGHCLRKLTDKNGNIIGNKLCRNEKAPGRLCKTYAKELTQYPPCK